MHSPTEAKVLGASGGDPAGRAVRAKTVSGRASGGDYKRDQRPLQNQEIGPMGTRTEEGVTSSTMRATGRLSPPESSASNCQQVQQLCCWPVATAVLDPAPVLIPRSFSLYHERLSHLQVVPPAGLSLQYRFPT